LLLVAQKLLDGISILKSQGYTINTATVTAFDGPITIYLASNSFLVITGAIGNPLLTPWVVIK